MDYVNFLSKQQEIYNKFNAARTSIIKDGLKKHDLNNKGFYIVAFTHPSEISELVELHSKNIAGIVPGLVYTKDNVHTTVSDYNGQKGGFEANTEILKKLSNIVSQELRNAFQSPSIYYTKLLGNSNTVIVKGNPSYSFLSLSNNIVNNAKSQNIDLVLPWGGHITCARVNGVVTDKEKINQYVEYLDSYVSDFSINSKLKSLIVGHGLFSEDGYSFKLNVFDEYKLRN